MADQMNNPPPASGWGEVKVQLGIAGAALRNAVAAIRGAYTALVASAGFLANEAVREWGAVVQFFQSLFAGGAG